MYFTITGKKEISLNLNCPAKMVSDAIMRNIENPQHFFSKTPDKPFCGECKDDSFFLGLNYLNGRYTSFRKFVCTVEDKENGCRVTITFKNDFFDVKFVLLFLLTAVIAMKGQRNYKGLIVFAFILLLISWVNFNLKINKCMDELEYIFETAGIQE